MTFEIPESYSIISEEEHANMVRESAKPHKFETAGVIRKGWLSDIWTMDEDDIDGHLDDVEILVDCE
jgi:hypothetical protein